MSSPADAAWAAAAADGLLLVMAAAGAPAAFRGRQASVLLGWAVPGLQLGRYYNATLLRLNPARLPLLRRRGWAAEGSAARQRKDTKIVATAR